MLIYALTNRANTIVLALLVRAYINMSTPPSLSLILSPHSTMDPSPPSLPNNVRNNTDITATPSRATAGGNTIASEREQGRTKQSRNTPPSASQGTLNSFWTSKQPRKTEKVYPVLREKILARLSFIHTAVDPTVAFLPHPNSARTIPIYDKASFPRDQFSTGMNFFVYQNDYSLFPIKTENRWIRFLVNMWFNVDPHSFLHVMKVDLMDLGATFEIKQEQALNTCTNIVFLGAPNCINKTYAKEVLDMYLIPLEKELMESDPLTYPEAIHGLPWPSYSMVIEQPGGLFEAVQKGMKRVSPPRERNLFNYYVRLKRMIG